MQLNIQQQIASFKAARAAKSDIIADILKKSAETGETLDAETSAKYDEAKAEIGVIDKHLQRLQESESLLASTATPITVVREADEDPIVAARKARDERGGHQRVIAVEKKLQPGIGFARFVKSMAMANGDANVALNLAKQTYPEEANLHNVIKMFVGQGHTIPFLEKAAVAGALTSNAPWAGALVQYQDLANDFIEFLRPQTIIGKLQLRNVPFKVRVKRQTGGGSASWVGEGKAKPLSSLAFDTVTLDFTKIASIAVLTDETIRLSTPNAETLVRNELAAAVIQQMDSDFIDPANAGTANIKPASITNGATSYAATGTTTQAGIATDVLTLFSGWINANVDPSDGVWIMSPTTAMALGLMTNALGNKVFPGMSIKGGEFNGLPVVVSQAAGLVGASDGSHIVVLLKQSDILLADDGQVAVDASREASLEMSDAPANTSATPTGAQLVSMFQTNSVAVRAERWINWVKARATAAYYLTGVHWGGFPA